MELGKELMEAINPQKEIFSIPFFGHKIPVSDTVLVMWIIMAILIIAAIWLTRSLKTIPKGKQNVAEIIVDLVNSFTKSVVGHNWKLFAPYIGTILLFLIVANMASLFNIIPTGKELYELTHISFFEKLPSFNFKPPTKDINTTSCMAIMSMIMVITAGLRVKGFKGWLGGFVQPVPIILPFKILDYFIRPISLCFRLFGNILGAFIIMELLYMFIPAVFPAALSIYFDLFDGILQAYVFVFLTSLYIAEAIE